MGCVIQNGVHVHTTHFKERTNQVLAQNHKSIKITSAFIIKLLTVDHLLQYSFTQKYIQQNKSRLDQLGQKRVTW